MQDHHGHAPKSTIQKKRGTSLRSSLEVVSGKSSLRIALGPKKPNIMMRISGGQVSKMLGTLGQLEGLQVWEKVRGKGKSPTRGEIHFHEKRRSPEEGPTKKLSTEHCHRKKNNSCWSQRPSLASRAKKISGCWTVLIGGSAFALSGGSPETELNRVWKIRNSAWID